MNNDISKKIDFAKDILEHNHKLITLIDTKAGLVLGSAGVILGFFLFFQKIVMTDITKFMLIITIILLGCTVVFSFFTIFPRLTTKKKYETVIFYKSILQQSKEEYKKTINDLTDEKILEDYSNNIFSLSNVQERKFKTLKISFICMTSSIFCLIIVLAYNILLL